MASGKFVVGLEGDLFEGGQVKQVWSHVPTRLGGAASVQYRPMNPKPSDAGKAIHSVQFEGANAAMVLSASPVTKESLSSASDLVLIQRFGVGFDGIDLDACTKANVAVCITAGAVDHSMAEGIITWMLYLTHRVGQKNAAVAAGDWAGRTGLMGCELRGRTFGAIGGGGIGSACLRMLQPFGMKQPLIHDPFLKPEVAAEMGARLVSLDELLRTADFVSVHCPLNDKTRNLINAEAIAKMHKGAYLLNAARGGIVDERALEDALREKKIAGAALDVFANEPVTQPHPLAKYDNFVGALHCIGWTDELFRDIGNQAVDSVVSMSRGQRPAKGVLNPQVFDSPAFQAKWKRVQSSAAARL